MLTLSTQNIDESWTKVVSQALASMEPAYIDQLATSNQWLPGPDKIFNAFSLPLQEVRYILFGESPYPRKASANGYAFWDARVGNIWSETGLSVEVNRATSLRNIIKMLLVAEGALEPTDTTQGAIAQLNKSQYVSSLSELFQNFQAQGILLLNASLVLSQQSVRKEARAWEPFMGNFLREFTLINPGIKLILLGKVAHEIDRIFPGHTGQKFYAEHPYNLSFITNKAVLDFFKPLHLLRSV